MVRTSAALLGVLLLAASAAAAPVSAPGAGPSLLADPATGGSAPPAVAPSSSHTPPNTTAVLVQDGERRGFHAPGLTLSAALSMQHAATRWRLFRGAFAHRYTDASTEARRSAALRRAVAAARAEVQALRRAERHVRRGFANGSLSATAALRRIARLQSDARAVDRTLARLESRAVDLGATGRKGRIDALRVRLAPLQSPVRERAAAAIRGNGSSSATPPRVFLAATPEGIRLSTVDNGTFYHETYRVDNDDNRTVESPSIRAAERRAAELYPWAWNGARARSVSYLRPDVYRVRIEHPHGTLVSHVDATSMEVVREVQRKNLSAALAGPSVSTSNDDVGDLADVGVSALVVNRTYAGGPLRVEVAGPEGGPVDATIRIDDVVVGRTGDDGVVWTVGPGGGSDGLFIVTAERGRDQVSVIVAPVPADHSQP